MKFLIFYLLLWVIFALMDPDPVYGSGSTDMIESGSDTDPNPVANTKSQAGKRAER